MMEYGERSPQNTVCIASLTRYVGRRGRVVSLFTETSSNSSLGGLCTRPKRWAQRSVIEHRHLCQVGQLGGLVELMGHVSGAQVFVR